MTSPEGESEDRLMHTARPATHQPQADADVRNRPVVLDTGALTPATHVRGRAARAVLGVAIATVLAAGAIGAGSWSIITAARGNPPANQPAPLWYPTPQHADREGATESRTTTPTPGLRDRPATPAPDRRPRSPAQR